MISSTTFSKSTLLHLRIPFSFMLMPIFWWAVSISTHKTWLDIHWWHTAQMFLIWHLLVYPASHAYNSYFDKDEESIGGLEKPPLATKDLYYVANFLDFTAILWAIWVHYLFGLGVAVYILVSRAYSYDKIRLKKYPFLSWLVVGLFQGAWVVWCVGYVLDSKFYLIEGLLSSLMLWASYPLTQIYQHSEDKKRGDITLSLFLGIRGTFLFAIIGFLFAGIGFSVYFFGDMMLLMAFHITLFPVVGFFLFWANKTLKNPKEANFKNAMRMNILSATCLNIFFMGKIFW